VSPSPMARPAVLRCEERTNQLPFRVRKITPNHAILPLQQSGRTGALAHGALGAVAKSVGTG
jgi:hypothetical protein